MARQPRFVISIGKNKYQSSLTPLVAESDPIGCKSSLTPLVALIESNGMVRLTS